MAQNFNAIEALKIALNQEKDGYAYYTAAIKKINDEELKEILQRLANDELEHEKIFTKMLNEVTQNTTSYFDDDNSSIAQYLASFVKTIFI